MTGLVILPRRWVAGRTYGHGSVEEGNDSVHAGAHRLAGHKGDWRCCIGSTGRTVGSTAGPELSQTSGRDLLTCWEGLRTGSVSKSRGLLIYELAQPDWQQTVLYQGDCMRTDLPAGLPRTLDTRPMHAATG